MKLRELLKELEQLRDDDPHCADWEVVFVVGVKPRRQILAIQQATLDQYPDDSGFVVLRSLAAKVPVLN